MNTKGEDNTPNQTEINNFLKRYVPLLEEIETDPNKNAWCHEYGSFSNKKIEDPYNLYDQIYGGLAKDAYANGIVLFYYQRYDLLFEDKTLFYRKVSEKEIKSLTDEQLLAIIGTQIRSDHFDNSLISLYVADGLLLYYMKELYYRRFPIKKNIDSFPGLIKRYFN